MEEMRYFDVLLWTIILGQVAGFIGGALNQQAYNFQTSVVVSAVFAIIFFIVPAILDKSDNRAK
ncbi:hypothetical protein FC72_GL000947 [Companilactobacillus tucceti DSM 20183]|uniref:DUF2929 domain-containing protein n=2 Tax=Companilactobacillus TaxID=2767879 RepID=A0A0R1J2E4_9LACO|nr:YjzD family protein [Companilactobacillus tucceti]KRK65477.1 hypothetical protein FC72_GL000947 [Companilactobacillus tucceti DSM 20183]